MILIQENKRLLSDVGPNVYNTAKSLSEATPLTEKTYTELCELLIAHYGSKRLVVSELFRFYGGSTIFTYYCTVCYDSTAFGLSFQSAVNLAQTLEIAEQELREFKGNVDVT